MRERSILAVVGTPGTGRRTAVAFWLRHFGASVAYLEFPEHSRRRNPDAVVASLAEMVLGEQPTRRARHRTYAVAEALAGRDTAVWIHGVETQRRETLELLRTAWLRAESGFPLILSGTTDLQAVLYRDPALAVRADILEFAPLSSLEVARWIPGCTALFARAPDDLLLRVNDAYTHGLIGRWVKFAAVATELHGPAPNGPALTKKIANQAIEQLLA